jgi:lipoyl(octanoyl) transferase
MALAARSPSTMPATPIVRYLGRADYGPVWSAMRRYTEERAGADADQLWLLEHPPVYTLGLNGRREHLLAPGEIPVVQVDRGGQVTYHGPGQAVVYLMLDLQTRNLGVRALVSLIERSLIGQLAGYGIEATARPEAPGVYVHGRKIASIGLRIRRQRSYHGVALNVDMDLAPFAGIDPCGYAGLEVTQLKDEGAGVSPTEAGWDLVSALVTELSRSPARTPQPV